MTKKLDLLELIEGKQEGFSKGQKRIAKFVLEKYDKAVYLTAVKLGDLVGVSESTVVRFAIELGFEGYPEFQAALEEIVRTKLTSKQRIELTSDLIGRGNKHILKAVLQGEIERLEATIQSVDEDTFDKVVDTIINANKIYIVGGRSSSMIAEFFGANLNLIMENVVYINSSISTEILEHIFRIKEGDVFIGISFPRYSASTVKAISYASAHNATTIVITDSEISPLSDFDTYSMYAKSDMVSFVDSLVAPLSLINAILVAISEKKKDELTVVFDSLEKLWDEYNIYTKQIGYQ